MNRRACFYEIRLEAQSHLSCWHTPHNYTDHGQSHLVSESNMLQHHSPQMSHSMHRCNVLLPFSVARPDTLALQDLQQAASLFSWQIFQLEHSFLKPLREVPPNLSDASLLPFYWFSTRLLHLWSHNHNFLGHKS